MTESWKDTPSKVKFVVSMTLVGDDLEWALEDPSDFLMNRADHYVSSYDYSSEVIDG